MAVAQNRKQTALDSLNTIFFLLKENDTANIVKTGNAILKLEPSDKQKFEIFQRLAETFFLANNANKSIAFLFKAKETAENTADAQMMAQAYGSIANQYSYLNLTEKARVYLNRAIFQIERLPAGNQKHLLKALSYLELGNLDLNCKNYQGANSNQKLSLAQFKLISGIADDKTNRYNYRRAFYNIGNSYYYLNKPDSAEIYLNRALALKDTENPNLQYFIYATLAEVYTLRGENKRAISTLQSVLKDPLFDNQPLKVEVLFHLSQNYKKIGDKANYTVYNERHLALRDTVEGHTRKAIDTAFSVEQKDYLESILESRRRNTWLVYGIFALVIAGGGLLFYLNRKKKRQHLIYLSVISKLQEQSVSPELEGIEQPPIKSGHSIPMSVEEEILKGLRDFEEQQGYRNPKLTVSMLAVQIRTNPAYISAIIKEHKDQNFNSYINELRIRYICRKIHMHREYAHYKISFLAEDCGFTSHSTFSTIFKKITGISPSVFLEEEGKRHDDDLNGKP